MLVTIQVHKTTHAGVTVSALYSRPGVPSFYLTDRLEVDIPAETTTARAALVVALAALSSALGE